MRIRAAVVESSGGPFTVGELDLDQPRPDEILVRITASESRTSAGLGRTAGTGTAQSAQKYRLVGTRSSPWSPPKRATLALSPSLRRWSSASSPPLP